MATKTTVIHNVPDAEVPVILNEAMQEEGYVSNTVTPEGNGLNTIEIVYNVKDGGV